MNNKIKINVHVYRKYRQLFKEFSTFLLIPFSLLKKKEKLKQLQKDKKGNSRTGVLIFQIFFK